MHATNIASIDVKTLANRAIYCLFSPFLTYVSRQNLYFCKNYDVNVRTYDVMLCYVMMSAVAGAGNPGYAALFNWV